MPLSSEFFRRKFMEREKKRREEEKYKVNKIKIYAVEGGSKALKYGGLTYLGTVGFEWLKGKAAPYAGKKLIEYITSHIPGSKYLIAVDEEKNDIWRDILRLLGLKPVKPKEIKTITMQKQYPLGLSRKELIPSSGVEYYLIGGALLLGLINGLRKGKKKIEEKEKEYKEKEKEYKEEMYFKEFEKRLKELSEENKSLYEEVQKISQKIGEIMQYIQKNIEREKDES